MAVRGAPLGVMMVSRRVAQSPVAKRLAARVRVQIVSEGAADFVLTSPRLAFGVFELDYNLTEKSFEALLANLNDLRAKFERRYVRWPCLLRYFSSYLSIMLLMVPHSESLDLFQRLQRTYPFKYPLLLPCASPDKAAAAIHAAVRIASAPQPPPRPPLSDEQELQCLLQGVPCLRREDVHHLVLAFGSVPEFARNVHDQELDLLLGPERARETREYLTVNRPLM